MNQNNIYISFNNLSNHTQSLDSIVLSDWNNSLEFHGSVLSILLILTSALSLISSVICFIYINHFLQVNKINRLLLRVHGIELLCGLSIALIGHILMSYSHDIWTCFLSLSPSTVLAYMATNTCMCISGARYYTKLKATQSQVANTKQIRAFIIYNKMFSYLVQIVVNTLSYWFQIDVEFILCANIPTVENKDKLYIETLIAVLYYVPLMMHTLVSLFCEMRLKLLFNSERQNRIKSNQPDHLVPWRAVGANLDKNNIPQKSTYVFICSTILAFTAIFFYGMGVGSDDSIASRLNLQCTAILILTVYSIFYTPIILIFTHLHASNRRIFRQQPPAELQFHDIMTIPNIELSVDNSEEAECSVNPAQESAIYSNNHRHSALEAIVHSSDKIANVESFDEYFEG